MKILYHKSDLAWTREEVFLIKRRARLVVQLHALVGKTDRSSRFQVSRIEVKLKKTEKKLGCYKG